MTATETPIKPPKRRKFRLIATGAIAIVVVAGGSLLIADKWVQKPALAATAPISIPVQIAPVRQSDVPIYLSGLGTVQAYNTVTVKTQVDGQLQSVLFTEGQEVKKGDLLAVIDPRPFQAALDEATAKLQQDQASLTNAEYLLGKDQTLAAEKIVTGETLETQQTTVINLKALIAEDQGAKDAAQISLSYTRLTAPIDGRTGFRQVDPGNQIHTTDANGIVVLTQTKPISVISTLSEDDLAAIRDALNAGPVSVTAFSRDGKTALGTGTVSLIDNEIDQTSGTVHLKSTFPNADEALWPGQFVDVRVEQKVLKKAITIPSAALQRGPNGYFSYVVNADGTVRDQPVTAGPITSGQAVITAGLTPSDHVVTSGQYRLQPGSLISVQNVADATSQTTVAKE